MLNMEVFVLLTISNIRINSKCNLTDLPSYAQVLLELNAM